MDTSSGTTNIDLRIQASEINQYYFSNNMIGLININIPNVK